METCLFVALSIPLTLLSDSQQLRWWEGKRLLNGGETWLQLPHCRFHWLPSGINEKWQSPRCLGRREEVRECGIWRERCRPFQSVVGRSNYIHLFTPHTLSMDGRSIWATAARWTTEGDGFWIQGREKLKRSEVASKINEILQLSWGNQRSKDGRRWRRSKKERRWSSCEDLGNWILNDEKALVIVKNDQNIGKWDGLSE